mmetsp:Transcript_76439/g.212331  ORF Transcript_76439/g.212331 Transcript_76439/m.212331 type:complete len:167 (-) Transcript_76439:276-776(-)
MLGRRPRRINIARKCLDPAASRVRWPTTPCAAFLGKLGLRRADKPDGAAAAGCIAHCGQLFWPRILLRFGSSGIRDAGTTRGANELLTLSSRFKNAVFSCWIFSWRLLLFTAEWAVRAGALGDIDATSADPAPARLCECGLTRRDDASPAGPPGQAPACAASRILA